MPAVLDLPKSRIWTPDQGRPKLPYKTKKRCPTCNRRFRRCDCCDGPVSSDSIISTSFTDSQSVPSYSLGSENDCFEFCGPYPLRFQLTGGPFINLTPCTNCADYDGLVMTHTGGFFDTCAWSGGFSNSSCALSATLIIGTGTGGLKGFTLRLNQSSPSSGSWIFRRNDVPTCRSSATFTSSHLTGFSGNHRCGLSPGYSLTVSPYAV